MKANRLSAHLASMLVVGLLASACGKEDPFPSLDEMEKLNQLHTMPRHPPADTTNRFADDARAASLGNRLFHDPQLSSCGTVACSSCHDGDGRTVPTAKANGCNGGITGRNPPTVLNVDYLRWFMWDGRADRLWNQAILPMTSEVEMNSNPSILRTQLNATYMGEYTELFNKTPGETQDDEVLANVGKLMQAYERTVKRLDSPSDEDVKRFLAAVDAGTEEQDPAYLGLKTFFRKGQCIACHQGVTMSDNLFHNLGVADGSDSAAGQQAKIDFILGWKFNAAGPFSDNPTGQDAARLAGVRSTLDEKRPAMEGAYKTPTLRNVALTAPYMHTGEFKTLEEVVDFYDKGGDPTGTFAGVRTQTIKKLDLQPEEKAALVKLLESLTGTP